MSQVVYVENEPKIEYSESLRRAISLRESPKNYVKTNDSISKYETNSSHELVRTDNEYTDEADYYHRHSPVKRLNKNDKSWKVLATSLPKSYAELHREKRGISSRSSSRRSTALQTPLQPASKFQLPKEQTISEESIEIRPPSNFKLPPAPPGAVYAPFIVPYYLDSSGKPVIVSQTQFTPEQQGLIQNQFQQPLHQFSQQQPSLNSNEYSQRWVNAQNIPRLPLNEIVQPKTAETLQLKNETSYIIKREETPPSQNQIIRKASSKMEQKEPSSLRVVTTANKSQQSNQQQVQQRPHIVNETYTEMKEIELDNRVYVPLSKVPYYERSYNKHAVKKKQLTRQDQVKNLKNAETKGFKTYFDKVIYLKIKIDKKKHIHLLIFFR
jgi:hypothetical protein